MSTKHEKLLTLKTGRSIKLVGKPLFAPDLGQGSMEWDILIKDPQDSHFHPLIENSHPIYWKIKKLSPLQRKLLELQYSGIQKGEIKKVIAELGILMGKSKKAKAKKIGHEL